MTANKWIKTKIGNVCSITSSKRIYANEYTSFGVPFYRSKEIIEKYNGIKNKVELYISEERFEEIKKKYGMPKLGDILLTSVGTLGVPWLVDENRFYFKDGNLTWFSTNEKCDSGFLYYWFQSNYARKQIFSKNIGSTQKALTIDSLSKFDIYLPDVSEQKRIAKELINVDLKIKNNIERINNLIEQQMTLFDDIFSKHIVFPDDCICTVLSKVTKNERTKTGDSNHKVFSALNTGVLALSEEYFSKQVFSKETNKYILVRKKFFAYNPARINIGSIGYNEYDFDGCVSPVYVVFSVQDEYENFFRCFIKSKYFKQQAILRASGSVRQSLNYADFGLIEINYPSLSSVRKFNLLFNPMNNLIESLKKENTVLNEMKNTLINHFFNESTFKDEYLEIE